MDTHNNWIGIAAVAYVACESKLPYPQFLWFVTLFVFIFPESTSVCTLNLLLPFIEIFSTVEFKISYFNSLSSCLLNKFTFYKYIFIKISQKFWNYRQPTTSNHASRNEGLIQNLSLINLYTVDIRWLYE